MLKEFYATQEEIPENQRGAYVQRNGRWELDELPATHPVVAKRDELLRENTTHKSTITRLTNEKSALDGKTLPEGHVAVPAADKQFLDKVRTLGSADEIVTKVSEHATLKEKDIKVEAEKYATDLADAMGWNQTATRLLLPTIQGLPKTEIKTAKDAKGNEVKTVVALVPSAPGSTTMVEKPFAEVLETIQPLKEALPVLTAKQENRQSRTHPQQGPIADDQITSDDPVAKRLAQREQSSKANPNPLMPQASAQQPAGAAAT